MAYKVAYMRDMRAPGEKKMLRRNRGIVHSEYELIGLATFDGSASHFTLFTELAVILNCEKQKEKKKKVLECFPRISCKSSG